MPPRFAEGARVELRGNFPIPELDFIVPAAETAEIVDIDRDTRDLVLRLDHIHPELDHTNDIICVSASTSDHYLRVIEQPKRPIVLMAKSIGLCVFVFALMAVDPVPMHPPTSANAGHSPPTLEVRSASLITPKVPRGGELTIHLIARKNNDCDYHTIRVISDSSGTIMSIHEAPGLFGQASGWKEIDAAIHIPAHLPAGQYSVNAKLVSDCGSGRYRETIPGLRPLSFEITESSPQKID